MDSESWNLEPGFLNLEPGTWNLEPEPGTRNLEPGTGFSLTLMLFLSI